MLDVGKLAAVKKLWNVKSIIIFVSFQRGWSDGIHRQAVSSERIFVVVVLVVWRMIVE